MATNSPYIMINFVCVCFFSLCICIVSLAAIRYEIFAKRIPLIKFPISAWVLNLWPGFDEHVNPWIGSFNIFKTVIRRVFKFHLSVSVCRWKHPKYRCLYIYEQIKTLQVIKAARTKKKNGYAALQIHTYFLAAHQQRHIYIIYLTVLKHE